MIYVKNIKETDFCLRVELWITGDEILNIKQNGFEKIQVDSSQAKDIADYINKWLSSDKEQL